MSHRDIVRSQNLSCGHSAGMSLENFADTTIPVRRRYPLQHGHCRFQGLLSWTQPRSCTKVYPDGFACAMDGDDSVFGNNGD